VLIEAGASINIQENNGKTALMQVLILIKKINMATLL